jgi:hypothetical protein
MRQNRGMRSHPGSLAIAVLLLGSVVAGCGDDDESAENAPPSSSSPDSPGPSDTSGPTDGSSATEAPAGVPAACDVLTPDDVTAAFGVAFGAPVPGGGGHTEQDLEWQSDNCSFEAEDLVEVQLALTAPEDFTGGSFQCPEPRAIASTVTPAEVPGATEAWWDVDEAPPLEATLRVCTEGYNFDIDLDYEDGVDFQGDPMQQSVALAGTVLEVLGG